MSWYYIDAHGATQGPTDISTLKSLYGTSINDITYIWDGKHVDKWTLLNQVPLIFKQLKASKNSNCCNQLTSENIDDILDEIEVNEEKQNIELNKIQIITKYTNINWKEISNQETINTPCIKKIISSKDININTQSPSDGMTLLMHSVIIGDFELVQKICNLGADVNIKDNDGDDALDFALIFGRYKITQLLLLLMNNLNENDISMAISDKNKEAKYMQQFGRLKDKIIQFVTTAIEERECFDINLLYFAWYFTVNNGNDINPFPQYLDNTNNTNPFSDPLQSKLFKTMMKTYNNIIKNKSKDKNGWKWLRKSFINSLIWHLPRPDIHHLDEADDDETDIDDIDDEKDNKIIHKYTNERFGKYIESKSKLKVQSIVSSVTANGNNDKLLFFLFL